MVDCDHTARPSYIDATLWEIKLADLVKLNFFAGLPPQEAARRCGDFRTHRLS